MQNKISKYNKSIKDALVKQLLVLISVFVVSLIISSIIYFYIGRGKLIKIDYDLLSKYSYGMLFFQILKRNIMYFVVITLFSAFGRYKLIYIVFILVSIYYGISMIYQVKIFNEDKLYFLYNFPDFLIYFPLLFYYTNLSLIISKFIKKIKKVETKRNKLDIIEVDYIKIACIFLVIIILYSCIYSSYLYLIIVK